MPSNGGPVRVAGPERPGARLTREAALLAVERPRLVGAARWVWARPWTVLPLSFVAFGVLGASNPDSDAVMFLAAGRRLLGPQGLDVFADPELQLGPLALLLAGVVAAIADVLGVSALFLLGAVQAVLVLVLAQAVAGRAATRGGTSPDVARWVLTAVLLLSGSLAEATMMGHAEEIGLGLALAWAALSCMDGRRWSVGLVLGLAVGVKLWAILGLPLALVDRRPRAAAARVAVALALALALYGPFLVWGDVRTFEFVWAVSGPSTVGLALGTAAPAGWGLRIAQGVAVLVVGAGLAWRRAEPLAVVAAVLAVRLLLDPIRFPYYSGPLLAVLVLWAWTSSAGVVRRLRVPVLVAAPVVTLAPYLLPHGLQAVVGTAVLVGVVVLATRSALGRTRATVIHRPHLPEAAGTTT
ncbi:glycosyltransferase 87 family protein [Cellulomonas fengjieae]|uniref:glycosyltransferase 87 family protein n=1 Tax=Cellulomonas fengjieae TaxID=2819978 RepID=UPI001AAE5E21|nr:glycosyltransferase 87 family protein [Cellulomonas fengjieae]MBO3102664.1 DUF2029 domain-containing protein [Cellulomonas fengjieae]